MSVGRQAVGRGRGHRQARHAASRGRERHVFLDILDEAVAALPTRDLPCGRVADGVRRTASGTAVPAPGSASCAVLIVALRA